MNFFKKGNLKKNNKILFFVPYIHGYAPSQRFRYEQYLKYLDANNFKYRTKAFLSYKTNLLLYSQGNRIRKLLGVFYGFCRRMCLLFNLYGYDYIFIHREASPIGPPIFEWIIAKIWKKKIIYDFDDAIWLANTSENNKIAASFKWHRKVASICKWSYKISVGNQYLAEYALQFNQNIVINPTTIDTENLHYPRPKSTNAVPVIGWTGTHSTMHYLSQVLPTLDKISVSHPFELLVISNQPPGFSRPYLKFLPWNKETEIEDLQKMDIGIMPLIDDQWAKGKCGFKALQYMALKIPAIVSPVGVNTEIVDNGISGFICDTGQEWEDALTKFLTEPEIAVAMAEACRQKVINNYSVLSNKSNFLNLFS